MAYTVHDTPAIIQRVEADLHHVARTVRDADPRLRSLVLTGGFARGEGAFRGGRPQNDYDFIALRSPGAPRRPYRHVAETLERQLGLHIDLSPVPVWRLRWTPPTIFWYETALRGKTVWGERLLHRIPVRSVKKIRASEGLRLLVNRAAGLVLVTPNPDPDARRLQAAKALLAAADSHLLALGEFAPGQTERWQRLRVLRQDPRWPDPTAAHRPWMDWAYHYKVDPERAPDRDPDDAWRAARAALLAAVPTAMAHARIPTLRAYARRDGLIDHVVFWQRSRGIQHARRFAWHPTAKVRVATLGLLEATPAGRVEPHALDRWLGRGASRQREPLRLLDALRKATLQ